MLGLGIAVFATVIPSFLVSISIKLINSSNFAVVAGIGPISTIILAVIFLNESLTLLQIIGTIVVILGILLVSKSKKN
jgi:drug/metabolite transporter (DMT)-like permease